MAADPVPPPPDKSDKSGPSNPLVRYTGLAFQMLGSIAVCTWLGIWLDRRFQTTTPWWTLGLALLGVVGAMLKVISDAKRDAGQ